MLIVFLRYLSLWFTRQSLHIRTIEWLLFLLCYVLFCECMNEYHIQILWIEPLPNTILRYSYFEYTFFFFDFCSSNPQTVNSSKNLHCNVTGGNSIPDANNPHSRSELNNFDHNFWLKLSKVYPNKHFSFSQVKKTSQNKIHSPINWSKCLLLSQEHAKQMCTCRTLYNQPRRTNSKIIKFVPEQIDCIFIGASKNGVAQNENALPHSNSINIWIHIYSVYGRRPGALALRSHVAAPPQTDRETQTQHYAASIYVANNQFSPGLNVNRLTNHWQFHGGKLTAFLAAGRRDERDSRLPALTKHQYYCLCGYDGALFFLSIYSRFFFGCCCVRCTPHHLSLGSHVEIGLSLSSQLPSTSSSKLTATINTFFFYSSVSLSHTHKHTR